MGQRADRGFGWSGGWVGTDSVPFARFVARSGARAVFLAGDPAQVLTGGVISWGPGFATPDAASRDMHRLAATPSVPLILVR